MLKPTSLVFVVLALVSSSSLPAENLCQRFGPQTPRDIDEPAGENPRIFSFAPRHTQLNLCNIHFHKHAEHKAADYSVGSNDPADGFRCSATEKLTENELRVPDAAEGCTNVAPGDTIEVHWVHTSCDIDPGPGLGSCVSETCQNPNLRVEAQVFLLVNDPDALDFDEFAYDGNIVDGFHQAKSLPADTGTPVAYLGSATAADLTQSNCSPLQVTWGVRPQCARLDIGSLHRWCAEKNVFGVTKASGPRPLVTALELLSPID